MTNAEPVRAVLGKHRLILGTWGLGGPHQIASKPFGWPEVDSRTAVNVIQTALDCGVRAFDTADFYGKGRSEDLLGTVLSNRPDVVVATKGGLLHDLQDTKTSDLRRDFSFQHLETALEGSLKRLRRETIDIYQLHGPPAVLLELEEPWRWLASLKKSGKVRYVGVSLSTSGRDRDLSAWLSDLRVDAIQLPYSVVEPLGLRHVDNVASKRGGEKVLFGRSVFHHGLLFPGGCSGARAVDDHRTTKQSRELENFGSSFSDLLPRGISLPQAMVGVALCGPAIDSVIVGATRPEQIRQVASMVDSIETVSPLRDRLVDAALTALGKF